MQRQRKRDRLQLLLAMVETIAEYWLVNRRPASISTLGRRLGTNYNTASNLVGMLVNAGILRSISGDKYRVGGNAAAFHAITSVIEDQLSLGYHRVSVVNKYFAEVENVLMSVSKRAEEGPRVEGPEEQIVRGGKLYGLQDSKTRDMLVGFTSLYYRAADYGIVYMHEGSIHTVPVFILTREPLAAVKLAMGIAFAALSGERLIIYDPENVIAGYIGINNVGIARSVDDLADELKALLRRRDDGGSGERRGKRYGA